MIKKPGRKAKPLVEFYETSRQMPSGRRRREYSWRLLASNRRILCVPGESFTTTSEAVDNMVRCKRDFKIVKIRSCRWAKPKKKRRR